jgi:phosphomannomutase
MMSPKSAASYRGRGISGQGSKSDKCLAVAPLYGVGWATTLEVLRWAGFDHEHTRSSQFAPDPDFPTTPFPTPEEPGVVDALLDPGPRGRRRRRNSWRKLSATKPVGY